MSKRLILFIITAIVVVLVFLVFTQPQLMISPGKVIDAHREFAEDCFKCHTPMLGSTAQKCIACHTVAEIGIKTTKGRDITRDAKDAAFHQELVVAECVACHSDHKGVMKFRPANQFSHALLPPATQRQCDHCHDNPGDSLHKKIKGNCGECHTQDAWQPATFEHEKYFRFDRDHDTDCDTCHVDNNYARYTCYGCHEHSRSNVREEHLEEGIKDFKNCVECHRSADEDEAERIWERKRRRQNKGGDD